MIWDFFLALGYFTRIPVPNHPKYSEDAMRRSVFYFPLVGLLVGLLLAGIFFLASQLWSVGISVLLTMACGFLITGGFHEDGWADTWDGLGGAFSIEKKLSIMTDSRLGTYGSLALWAILSLKAVCLIDLLPETGIIALIFAHAISRWVAISPMVFNRYVRIEANKAKPVVQSMSVLRWLSAFVFVFPILYFVPWTVFLILTATSGVVAAVWILFLKRQIGGYTGDTLGALQQLTELCLYLVWLCI